MLRKILWSILVLFMALSCKEKPEFRIDGKITNNQSNMIYLEKLELQGPVPFDSARIDQKGRFRLKGSVSIPTFFLLKLNENKFITLLLDSSEQVEFSADYLNFSTEYKVEGSFGSQKVQELNKQLTRTLLKLDSINSMITLCQNDYDFQEKLLVWQLEKEEIVRAQSQFSKEFIMQNPFSLSSILAIYQRINDESYVVQDLQTIKTAASALNTLYPNSDHVKKLYDDTKKMMQGVKNLEMRQLIEKYGRNSPDILLPDKSGKQIALSSLEGKYVLLHFWSALNKESRVQNPVLKENYNQYRSKGFEIYQVSIDTLRNEWINALEEDQLSWINVGDMEGSYSAIMSYNIGSIPANYLLDREGKIIAKNLKGPTLNATLNKILN
jgi:peroxiredoxin